MPRKYFLLYYAVCIAQDGNSFSRGIRVHGTESRGTVSEMSTGPIHLISICTDGNVELQQPDTRRKREVRVTAVRGGGGALWTWPY
jgi:hypothetical protein